MQRWDTTWIFVLIYIDTQTFSGRVFCFIFWQILGLAYNIPGTQTEKTRLELPLREIRRNFTLPYSIMFLKMRSLCKM